MRTPPNTSTAPVFTPGFQRLYVHTEIVCGMSGYEYFDDAVTTLRPSYSGLISSAILGAEGMHAPVLDVDHPVTLTTRGEDLSVLTIKVTSRGWKVRSLGRVLGRLGLSPTEGAEGRLGPRGLDRVDEVSLVLAAPVQVVESSPGRHHVFIDHALNARQYGKLVRALARAGIVERAWMHGTPAYTCVRTPGARKRADLSGAAARLAAGPPQR